MKKILTLLFSFSVVLFPLFAFAQNFNTGGNPCDYVTPGTLQKFICTIGNILNTIIPVLIVLAVVLFIWGIIQYVIGSDEEAKKKGKDRMIFGIIGLVVIVAMWGLVSLVTSTFGLDSSNINVNVPTVPLF